VLLFPWVGLTPLFLGFSPLRLNFEKIYPVAFASRFDPTPFSHPKVSSFSFRSPLDRQPGINRLLLPPRLFFFARFFSSLLPSLFFRPPPCSFDITDDHFLGHAPSAILPFFLFLSPTLFLGWRTFVTVVSCPRHNAPILPAG